MFDQNNLKGRLLEEIVKQLYTDIGLHAEKNAQLPVINGSGRTREIDVLLRADDKLLDDCSVLIPIECKNYGNKVGVGLIDAFVGKLVDLGIPPAFGIFVSTIGFTKGASERAKKAGISTLVLDGLADDRLSMKVRNSQAPPTFECYCQFYGESNLPFCACFFSFLSEFCGAGLISLNQWWDGSGCRP